MSVTSRKDGLAVVIGLILLVGMGSAFMQVGRSPGVTGGKSSGSGAVWGSITGTLSSQSDLQSALNALAPLANPTFTGTITAPIVIVSGNGASSVSPFTAPGVPFAGTATTSTPLIYLNTTGSASCTAWSTAGTYLGVCDTSSFNGDWFNFFHSGSSTFRVSKAGALTLGNVITIAGNGSFIFSGGPLWTNGAGSPEGVVTGKVGSFYSRTDGGASTSLYVKETGTGNTGWIAK